MEAIAYRRIEFMTLSGKPLLRKTEDEKKESEGRAISHYYFLTLFHLAGLRSIVLRFLGVERCPTIKQRARRPYSADQRATSFPLKRRVLNRGMMGRLLRLHAHDVQWLGSNPP